MLHLVGAWIGWQPCKSLSLTTLFVGTQTFVTFRSELLLLCTYVYKRCCAVAECLPPTRLSQLSNQLLLGSFQGFKAAAQVAQWASHRLRRHVWGATHHFPLAVTTQSGQTVTVNAVSSPKVLSCRGVWHLAHMHAHTHVHCNHVHTHACSTLIHTSVYA